MESAVQDRDNALRLLDKQKDYIAKVFIESINEKGRGALVVYTEMLEKGHKLDTINYNTREESINLFEDAESQSQLAKMIGNYNPKTEGIVILITKSTATWFVTTKLMTGEKSN